MQEILSLKRHSNPAATHTTTTNFLHIHISKKDYFSSDIAPHRIINEPSHRITREQISNTTRSGHYAPKSSQQPPQQAENRFFFLGQASKAQTVVTYYNGSASLTKKIQRTKKKT